MDYVYVNGVKLYAPSNRDALIDYAFMNKSILVAINAEKILHATNESKSIINRNVGYPDGYGALLGLKKKGFSNVIKVPGCELWLDIVKKFYKNKSFYFVGGKEEVIQDTIKKLKDSYPRINIVNYRNGYINDDVERNELLIDIADKKPDVVFVAMGSPRQEILMEQMSERHMALYQGLGGSFDVYTGKVSRASDWWVKHNLEWLYRLINEPVRIKRQVYLLKFLFNLKLNRF